MDWNQVITRNHALLLTVVAELFAMLRMVDKSAGPSPLPLRGVRRTGELRGSPRAGASRSEAVRGSQLPNELQTPSATFTLPRHLFNAIMLILRPCESAVRRLIIIAACSLELKPRASRPFPAGVTSFVQTGITRMPLFQLIDPLKDFPLDVFDNDPQPSSSFMPPFNPALA